MLGSNIRTAFRILFKHRFYTFINLTGLSVGLACCMLIVLYVSHEFHYDRYHADSGRVYRVVVHAPFYKMQTIAKTSDLTVPEIKRRFPQVEAAARLYKRSNLVIRSDENIFYENDVVFTEPEMLRVLTIPVEQGSAESLSQPGQALLTVSLAQKLFGAGPYSGRTLEINGQMIMVAGLVSDPPTQTHLRYQCLVSLASLQKQTRQDWTRYDTGSYVKLKSGINRKAFGEQLATLTESDLPPPPVFRSPFIISFKAAGHFFGSA